MLIPPAEGSPFGPATYLWLLAVPLLPLAAWMLQATIGRFLPRQGDWLPTGAMAVAAAIAIYWCVQVFRLHDPDFLLSTARDGYGWRFLYSGQAPGGALGGFSGGILYDNLAAILLAMVALVSFLVHLFSVGYMHGDSRYNVFFSNLPLFTFAMLALVLSDNLLFFFVFWEIMGLCSYLLIGHLALDKKEPRMSAAWASLKAFMTTRIGDVALFLGMCAVWAKFGTLSFHELYSRVAEVTDNGQSWPLWLTVAGLLMFGGSVGKSAQFPLHVWLPDAMEGPTPVSAMIHAATMVAAGVYLAGRVILLCSPDAQLVMACVGGFTALFAATIGMAAFDIKKVLAYSTISQLGYMICAIGVGGVAAGLFHVITHAFFKACLFLGSGSVIHGCHHEQDMRHMGGLRRRMKITYLTMLVSTLAIAGVPLFAGFYSKDAIIAATLEKKMTLGAGDAWLWALPFFFLILSAVLTAFYMFRLIHMTFHGQARSHHAEHAHESPASMTIPLIVLAALAIFGGRFWPADPAHALSGGREPWFLELVHDPKLENWNPQAIEAAGGWSQVGARGAVAHDAGHAEEHGAVAHAAHSQAMLFSILAAGLGILLSYVVYQWRLIDPARVARALGGFYTLVYNKYGFDELYHATVIRGTMLWSQFLSAFDARVIDGIANGIGRLMSRVAGFSAAYDRVVVDGAVNWLAESTSAAGQSLRRVQTGRIQQYAYFTFAGAVVLAVIVLLDLF
ncbi:MAG: NADH-quinone oxidoreductase subunit L [Planctomycetota bacterium]|nr:MAG: NADH-quinone oxidoreductase subunit L [Planctomycetota bacterium]